MTPSNLGHAAPWLKALSHETGLRLPIPSPPTAGPRDDLDAAKRVTASVMDRRRRTPILIAILTTIGSHRSLAQMPPRSPSSRIGRKNGRWSHHDAYDHRDASA